MKGRGIECLIFLLFIFLEGTLAISKEVVLRSKSQCYTSDPHVIDGKVNKFDVFLILTRYDCNSYEQGFHCTQHFIKEEDSYFDNLGKQLCVDIQGIQKDISDTKLIYEVSDEDNSLKKVYSSTLLKPETDPYYVCTNKDALKVTLSVRKSEYICPDPLNYMFNHRIAMGTVMALPSLPIVEVKMHDCHIALLPDVDDDSFLFKVNATGAVGECHNVQRLPQHYSYVRVCMKLLYYSPDFECPIELKIFSEGGDDDDLTLTVSRRPGSNNQICETYAGRHGKPRLIIKNYLSAEVMCKGNIAFRVDMRESGPPDDDSRKASPNLYMAVFITLIAICLVCLALTCLCCIRFRAKRLRRLQRRSSRREHTDPSVPNPGFQYDGSAPYDHPISWSPSQPGMLFGLPSYDDVVGMDGVNPSDDSRKDDLPPAYDTVFSSTET